MKGSMNVILIILIGILFASLGQVFWKLGMNAIGSIDSFSFIEIEKIFLNPYIILGLVMYGLGTIFWLVALSNEDLSYVYPFIALTFIIVLFLSYFILKEQIGTMRIIGTIIIIIGLMIIIRN
jgi:uncharacterized membrane protein